MDLLLALERRFRAHFLPIGLIVGAVVALACPSIGAAAASVTFVSPFGETLQLLPACCVVVVFLVQGLTLNTDDLAIALRSWRTSLFGVVSILTLTPLVSLAYGMFDVLDPSFRNGLTLFACMPTTINSGIVLATAAGGSPALALLLTLGSNFLGVFTAPFVLAALLSAGADVRIDPWPLLANMLLQVLAPLVIGKLLREASALVHGWVRRSKPLLAYVAQGSICAIPWLALSCDAASLEAVASDASMQLAALLLLASATHALLVAFHYGVGRHALRLPRELLISLTIVASQKTLPFALTMLALLPAALGDRGLMAIPCLLSYLVQLLADAQLAQLWAEHVPPQQPREEPPSATSQRLAPLARPLLAPGGGKCPHKSERLVLPT